MAILDKLTSTSDWEKIILKSKEAIQRAASLQAQQRGIQSFLDEAQKIALSYSIKQKINDWHEYGDIAFHIIATWPPDMAYLIVYAFREISVKPNYDPIPFILKAIENIYYLNPRTLELHTTINDDVMILLDNPDERARRGAKIIIREISVTPLRWAAGIYNAIDPVNGGIKLSSYGDIKLSSST